MSDQVRPGSQPTTGTSADREGDAVEGGLRPSRSVRRGRPPPWLVAVVALVAGVGAGLWAVHHSGPSGERSAVASSASGLSALSPSASSPSVVPGARFLRLDGTHSVIWSGATRTTVYGAWQLVNETGDPLVVDLARLVPPVPAARVTVIDSSLAEFGAHPQVPPAPLPTEGIRVEPGGGRVLLVVSLEPDCQENSLPVAPTIRVHYAGSRVDDVLLLRDQLGTDWLRQLALTTCGR